MSRREVFFPGDLNLFDRFHTSSEGIFAALGSNGIFYHFIKLLLQVLGGMCVIINLTKLPTPFVDRGAPGGPGQHPGVHYSADIFIYLPPGGTRIENNQHVRDPNYLPPNHIHIYPCTREDSNNRTGCINGGVEKPFSSSLQEVAVGWKRKNGDRQCGSGALCGILYLYADINQLGIAAEHFYYELTNPGYHPAYNLNVNTIDDNYKLKRTSSPSVFRKQKSKSPKKGRKKSPKKGGRKSPRKSPKKGRKKSPKKGGRKSPKKSKKKVEAKRKSIYRRVLSQRRRKTIAASTEQDPIHYYYESAHNKFTPVNLITTDLKYVYLLLYNPTLFSPMLEAHIPEAANQLSEQKICEYLIDSNQYLSNCGYAGQDDKQPEHCGNCVISNNMVSLNLYNMFIGGVVNGRGTCQYEEYSNILWHTHPLTSRPWPSGEDIEKMIKLRPGEENDKIPVVSLIFTKWGIWQIVVPMHGKGIIETTTVKNITNTGWQLFEEKWQRTPPPPWPPTCLNNFQDPTWRESIRTSVNTYILKLAHHIPQLNPHESAGGFIQFNFWDTIAKHNFMYPCYIP